MSDYKFVTKEEVDVEAFDSVGGWMMWKLLAERDAFEKVAIMEQLNHFASDTKTDMKDPEVVAACLPESRQSVRDFAASLLTKAPSTTGRAGQ